MNLETILLNSVLIMLCIIPFILMGRFQQKRKKQLSKSITELAATQNCKITHKEFCADLVIGLDEVNNFLFFVKQKKSDADSDVMQFVNLSKVERCKEAYTEKLDKIKGGDNIIIEKVELKFWFLAENQNELSIELYNKNEKWQLNGEVQLIKKWIMLLQSRMKAIH